MSECSSVNEDFRNVRVDDARNVESERERERGRKKGRERLIEIDRVGARERGPRARERERGSDNANAIEVVSFTRSQYSPLSRPSNGGELIEVRAAKLQQEQNPLDED